MLDIYSPVHGPGPLGAKYIRHVTGIDPKISITNPTPPIQANHQKLFIPQKLIIPQNLSLA